MILSLIFLQSSKPWLKHLIALLHPQPDTIKLGFKQRTGKCQFHQLNFGFIKNHIQFRFLMYAGTFTASMKNTNFKSNYMQNKQRHLQVKHKCHMTSTA